MKSIILKFTTLFIGITFISLNVKAQNLVPNPSFENRNACYVDYGASNTYTTYGSINPFPAAPTVKQWYNNVVGTPDYYNVCAPTVNTTEIRHVPDNFTGYQYPHTGNAYVGAIMWSGSPNVGAEYFSSKLSAPMIAGHQYHLSFWVSLAETSRISPIALRESIYAINTIGAHFSQNEIVAGPNTSVLSYLTADIASNPNIFYSDTANWQKIEGTYTAVGGEQWMTIGNFTPWATQQKILIEQVITVGIISYYFFDDFCLKDIAGASKNSINKTNCDSTTISGNPSATMWTWSTGDTSQTIRVTQSGTYWVQSFANCQIYVDTFHMNIQHSGIPFDLGDNINHCGDTSLVLGPTDSTFTSYVWSNGKTTKNITVNASGTYYVTATTPCNTYSDTIRIAINPIPPKPNDFDTVMCRQPIRSYQVPIQYQGQSLIWVETATGTSTLLQPQVDLTVDKTYNFQVFNVSNAGCISAPASVIIEVHGEAPEITLRDTATCMSSVNIGMDFGMVDYKWSSGQNTCCINITETGTYTLTVTNQCGQDTAQSKVDIMNCNSCLWVPNAFSPNSDGLNDVFKIQKSCLLGRFDLSIYNRYGQRVYHSEDVSKGWDGTFNGKPCDIGTYYYYISADPSFESKQIILKGDIQLIQ